MNFFSSSSILSFNSAWISWISPETSAIAEFIAVVRDFSRISSLRSAYPLASLRAWAICDLRETASSALSAAASAIAWLIAACNSSSRSPKVATASLILPISSVLSAAFSSLAALIASSNAWVRSSISFFVAIWSAL